jgi:hypothetical protein
MKKSLKHLLKLLLIHKGIYLEIQDLQLKIIFRDLKICNLSSPICPKLSPRFLFNIIVEDFSRNFLFSIIAKDFPKIFQDFRFVCRLYSAEIFPKISRFSVCLPVQRFSPRFSPRFSCSASWLKIFSKIFKILDYF